MGMILLSICISLNKKASIVKRIMNTEKEKMLSGNLYNPADPELIS